MDISFETADNGPLGRSFDVTYPDLIVLAWEAPLYWSRFISLNLAEKQYEEYLIIGGTDALYTWQLKRELS